MNNERYNQIIDEAYDNYLRNAKHNNLDCLVKQEQDSLLVEMRFYYKEEFIKEIKTNPMFSEKWELKIKERELSFDERLRLVNYDKEKFNSIDEWITWYKNEPNEFYYMGINYTKDTTLTDLGVPTKLITLTYKDEKTEIYES